MDSIVNSFPKKIRSISDISFLIRKNFDSDSSKARATYRYISNTISYDARLAKKILNNNKSHKIEYRNNYELNKKLQKISFKTAQKTLRRKKGVCEGYAHLYKHIAESSGLTCIVETGLCKTSVETIGKYSKSMAHAWNMVKIGPVWKPLDVTWGSGYLDNKIFVREFDENYFLSNHKFYLNHLAGKSNQKLKNEFINAPLFHSNYLISELEIICQSQGTIKCSRKSRLINLEIKNLDLNDEVYVSFESEKYAYPVIIKKDLSHISELHVIYCPNKNDVLHIWVGKRLIVSYKVVLV